MKRNRLTMCIITTALLFGFIATTCTHAFAEGLIVTILSPEESPMLFKRDMAINFSGKVTDSKGNNLIGEAVMTWESDVDGTLGEGLTLSLFLSEGTHRITLTARGEDGSTASDQIIIGVGK